MKKQKKAYEKPTAKKHKAAAVVSGSGSSNPCSFSKRRVSGNTYYH